MPNPRFMFRIEPYLVKFTPKLEPQQIVEVYLTYLYFGIGSTQFMEFLFGFLAVGSQKIDLGCKKNYSL
jgi:hypothetical protein